MRAEFMSPATRGKIDADKRRQLTRRAAADADAAAAAASSSASAPSAYRAANSDYLRSQQQEQQTIRRQQDATLGKMDNALDRLMEMGRTIETELKVRVHRLDAQRQFATQGVQTGRVLRIRRGMRTPHAEGKAPAAGVHAAGITSVGGDLPAGAGSAGASH